MFKNLFIKHIRNTTTLIVGLSTSLVVFAFLILIYFFVTNDNTKHTILYVTLALHVFFILGNWATNVIMPRGRLRKKVPQAYDDIKKEYKSRLATKDIAEMDYYAKGLTFIIFALPSLIISIIFTVV